MAKPKWEEKHDLMKKRRRNRQLKSIMSETVTCPKCDTKVKLLWVPQDKSMSLPICEQCMYKQCDLDSDFAATYRVYFMPDISIHTDGGGSWEMKTGISESFPDIRDYIEICIEQHSQSDSLFTTDVNTLSSLLSVLKECHTKRLKKKIQKGIDVQANTISRLSIELEKYKRHDPKAEKLSWKMLPSGEHPFEHIKAHFNYLQDKNTEIQYDIERLEISRRLGPNDVYIGLDEFEGYVVFYFKKKGLAVLENPIVGNAAYLITGDWRELSKLTKAELLKSHQSEVDRVIHRGDWHKKLSEILC